MRATVALWNHAVAQLASCSAEKMGALTGCDFMDLTSTMKSASISFNFGLSCFRASTLWWVMDWKPWETCLMSTWVPHLPAITCILLHTYTCLFQCPEFAHPGTWLKRICASLKPSASETLMWCFSGTVSLAQGNILTLLLCGIFSLYISLIDFIRVEQLCCGS